MPKRILQGTVVSDKNEKTVVVKVERRFTHPVMKKTVRHDQEVQGARREQRLQGRRQVFIQESKPISKDKRWIVVSSSTRRRQTNFGQTGEGVEPVPLEEKKAASHDSDANKPRRRG